MYMCTEVAGTVESKRNLASWYGPCSLGTRYAVFIRIVAMATINFSLVEVRVLLISEGCG